MAEITAEQAQANLERKRENHNTPLTLVNDIKGDMDTILSRVMSVEATPVSEKEIEFFPRKSGFEIYVKNSRYEERHAECENSKVWDWPRYKGGACPQCEKAFSELWVTTTEKLRANINEYMARVGIGKRHFDCSIDGYEGPESVKKACNEIAKNPADLVLFGSPGTGKTHLAAGIIRKLILDVKIFRVFDLMRTMAMFITVPDLFLEIRSSFNSEKSEESESDIIDRLSTVPLLVLDDLGSEKPTEWAITTLYTIIDARYRSMKPTIVTTNLTLEQIAGQLHSRIASRLSSGKIIRLKGVDYRTKRDAQG